MSDTNFDPFFESMEEEIRDWVQRILESAGQDLMNHSVSMLESAGRVDSGDLVGSIGYTTAKAQKYHASDPKWRMQVPFNPLSMNVGTACPYGIYIKHGMNGYQGGISGNKGGFERIVEWAMRKGYSEHDAKGIAMHIMKEGVSAPTVNFDASEAEAYAAILRARRREPFKAGRKVRSKQFKVQVKV